jgi:hypothetical protein
MKKQKKRRPVDKLLIDPDFVKGITLVEVKPREGLIDPSILKSITNWT